jgi:predicted PurR-regulated permease PerM
LIISFIIAIYMLMDKERLLAGGKRLWKAITNEKSYQISTDFLGRCNSIMMQYIVFDLLDGLLIGILNAIFMLIVGYPYVPLISVIVGVTNLAPTFGPILGAVIGSLILFLINPWYALGFLIFTIALQTVDGYVIKPKLFGGQLGVPSIWILISLIVFGRLWGVIGILLAIPFAAIIDFIYQDVILFRLERRKKKAAAAHAAAKSSGQISPVRSQQPESDDPD